MKLLFFCQQQKVGYNLIDHTVNIYTYVFGFFFEYIRQVQESELISRSAAEFSAISVDLQVDAENRFVLELPELLADELGSAMAGESAPALQSTINHN